ncbi:MAG: endonuclease MutS2 [Candidatus Tectomicrobia bacterium]|nr:endonuclease MutS2 [Candidatus Tectomicrobia bacterium]
MHPHTLEILEFQQVLEQVAAYAQSQVGAAAVRRLLPREALWAAEQLAMVREMRRYLDEGLAFRCGQFEDVTPSLERLRIEGVILDPLVLRSIAHVLGIARLITADLAASQVSLPLLRRAAEDLYSNPRLEQRIVSAIDEHGDLRDGASERLGMLRQRLRDSRRRINDLLREFMEAQRDVVQEPFVTIRNQRYVIPLKASYRRAVGGFVHDQSASRSTLYVEPEIALPLNNAIIEQTLEEETEIRRILRRLTMDVAEVRLQLLRSIGGLALLDSLYARAAWASEHEATEPEFRRDGSCSLRRACHPLLGGGKRDAGVVPLDVELGGATTLLIITGPNTGGKTVVLKTVGLLHAMALAGLPLPAASESSVMALDDLFLDIGDEQSLQQNLSTFSGHCRQLRFILDQATPKTLVLLDELGSGTEPTEGAALAIAVADELRRRGVPTLISTHHNPLKVYAHLQPGVQNASMEFDAETLLPTFRLRLGFAGQSNAIAVAERLGFPASVLERARHELTGLKSPFEEMVESVHRDRAALATEQEALEQQRLAYERRRRDDEARAAALDEERRAWSDKLQREGGEFLKQARRQVEELVHTLREEAAAGRPVRFPEQVFGSLGGTLAEYAAPEPTGPAADEFDATPPVVGDTVELRQGGVRGIVERVDEGGRSLLVQASGRRLRVSIEAAVRRRAPAAPSVAAPPPAEVRQGSQRAAALSRQAREVQPITAPGYSLEVDSSALRAEINLIGQTVEEALANLDQFLDRAILSGLANVRIIHGKGTGALRRATGEFLRRHRQVRAFHAEIDARGGTGATIAELR